MVVPERVSAVAVNITVDGTTADAFGGFVTAYGCGDIPDASSLNFVSEQTVANAAIVPVADDGTICFAVDDEANLIVDVVGVLRAGAGFVPQAPQRVADTRRVERVGNIEGTGGPLEIQVTNTTSINGERVIAASLNLTVVDTETNDFGGFALCIRAELAPMSRISTSRIQRLWPAAWSRRSTRTGMSASTCTAPPTCSLM